MRDTTQQRINEQVRQVCHVHAQYRKFRNKFITIQMATSFLHRLSCCICIGAALLSSTPVWAAKKHHVTKTETIQSYRDRSDAMLFADNLADQQGWDRTWVRKMIGDARLIPAIQRQMKPAGQGFVKNWSIYRDRFIEPTRIEAGATFWRNNADTLARAEKEYGVPAEIIIGIIGVETFYGRHMGSYRAIDALSTLAFDFPKTTDRDRSAFFQNELGELLKLHDQDGIDVTSIKGSYAGAIGLGQFMPSSWIKYAVDFDGDGQIDLRGSPADAIGSIANFLKASNWKAGMPAYYPVSFDAAKLDIGPLLAPDIRPTFNTTELFNHGVILDENAAKHAGPLSLVELLNGDPAAGGSQPTYVIGTENFYALSRYNRSSYYVLAVISLGEAVRSEVSK
jgi:membrane-bound lytic murein transglycosylase B